MNNIWKKIRGYKKELLCIILGIAWLLLFGKIQLYSTAQLLNSDWAADLILARQCAKEGVVISHNISYTTEFKLLDLQLIKAIFFNIFYSWIKIAVCGNTVAFLFLYVSALFLLKKIGLKKYRILFISAITFILPFSFLYFEIALVAGFYTIKIILELLCLGLFYAFLKEEKNNIKIIYGICAAVLSIFGGIGGIRMTLLLFIPIVLTCIAQWLIVLYEGKNSICDWRKAITLKAFPPILWSLFFLACNGVGYLLNVKYFAAVYQFQSNENIIWGDIFGINIFQRLGERLAGVAYTLGYYGNIGVFSLEGIQNIFVWAVLIISIYCHIYIIKNRQNYSYFQINITLFSIFTFFTNCFVFVITDVFVDFNSSRYWVPILIFSIPVIGIYLDSSIQNFAEKILKFITIIICIGYIVLGCSNTITTVLKSTGNAYREPSIEFLEENNYTFGFATYWNANVTTALSNGKVEVASASPNMDFYLWGTTKEYYRQGYHNGKCFLLLTLAESAEYKEGNVLSNGIEVYRDEAFVIYSYDNVDTLLELAEKQYLNE